MKKSLLVLSAGTLLGYELAKRELFDKVFKRNNEYEDEVTLFDKWISKSNAKEVSINSYDGLKLYGLLVENHKTNNYIILVHGMHSWCKTNYIQATKFDKMGYNLLLIDQRASGNSEGKYISFGYHESKDIIEWINYLTKLNKKNKIALYGVSMGAATVMMSLKNKLPKNVVCAIEDCGYSSTKDAIDYLMRKEHHVPFTKPLINMLEKQIKSKLHFDLNDCNPADALINNDIPLMIIHGEDDEIIPFEMSKIIKEKNNSQTKYVSIKNCTHAQACMFNKFNLNVKPFLKEHFN